MNRKERLLIVEPSGIITEGLKQILKDAPQLEPYHPLDNIENLKERLAALKPDILLINPTMLSYNKTVSLQAIYQEYPQLTVVALVYQYMENALLRPYHGVLDIREPIEHIADILMKAHSSMTVHKIPADNSSELTKREIDVLILVAKGYMSKEIADKLNISFHTVITHRKNITRKTNIKSVAGLAMYAMMNNLIND